MGQMMGCPFVSLGTEVIKHDNLLSAKARELVKRYCCYFEGALREAHAQPCREPRRSNRRRRWQAREYEKRGSGAGKSTLSKVISGHLTRDAGSITLQDGPLNLRSAREVIGYGITMVMQETSLAPDLSVLENESYCLRH